MHQVDAIRLPGRALRRSGAMARALHSRRRMRASHPLLTSECSRTPGRARPVLAQAACRSGASRPGSMESGPPGERGRDAKGSMGNPERPTPLTRRAREGPSTAPARAGAERETCGVEPCNGSPPTDRGHLGEGATVVLLAPALPPSSAETEIVGVTSFDIANGDRSSQPFFGQNGRTGAAPLRERPVARGA